LNLLQLIVLMSQFIVNIIINRKKQLAEKYKVKENLINFSNNLEKKNLPQMNNKN